MIAELRRYRKQNLKPVLCWFVMICFACAAAAGQQSDQSQELQELLVQWKKRRRSCLFKRLCNASIN